MRPQCPRPPAGRAAPATAARRCASPAGAAAVRRRLAVVHAQTEQRQLPQGAGLSSAEALEALLPSSSSGGSDSGGGMAAGAEQPGPGAAVRGGALSLVEPGGKEEEVPRTLAQALATFGRHPSTLLILAGLAALLLWRAQSPLHPGADAAVATAVAAGWCLQEWAVHALLLHSKRDWVGRRIHVGHHQRPYFHVSIDDPPIVLAFMAASLALFRAGFGASELGLTAAIAYYAMGLLYEYTHFIVHCRYLPRSKLGKAIRMHHMLHHTKHEGYWLAFIAPPVDKLFGTAPDPATVKMSAMAKAGLQASRGSG